MISSKKMMRSRMKYKRSRFRRSLKVAQQPRTPVTMTTTPATTRM